MKKSRMVLVLCSVLLVFALCLSLCGCNATVKARDLMQGIKAKETVSVEDIKPQNVKMTDFALRLMKATEKKNENTLISPLSVISALAMTANGADNATLSQMEAVFGMTRDEVNAYLHEYMKSLENGEKYKLSLANSIWFNEASRFTVNNDFLQKNADYFGADIFEAPFDGQTLRDINRWVDKNTDGMIPQILDNIPRDAVMYLINALAFEAEWHEIYEKHQVRSGEFTNADGKKQKADFMYSSEGHYLEDEKATGFLKSYKGKYAFVALLPKKGVTVSEYLSYLDGEKLSGLLASVQYNTVNAAIPKFESEFECEMSDALKNMGIVDAFNPGTADFKKLGTSAEGNISISRVLHKTYISVAEKGTKAGAVTVVEMADGTAMETDPKEVYLDRPFVYMLIDTENNIPFFIGTMNDVKK